MFPGVSTEDIRVLPADDGELVVSVRGRSSCSQLNGRRDGLAAFRCQMNDRLFCVPDYDGLSSSMQPHAIARR